MPKLSTKVQLLETAGFKYNFDRMMFINRQDKRAFSIEFVDDKPETEIELKISEPKAKAEWEFYTNSPMSEGMKRELERVLQ